MEEQIETDTLTQLKSDVEVIRAGVGNLVDLRDKMTDFMDSLQEMRDVEVRTAATVERVATAAERMADAFERIAAAFDGNSEIGESTFERIAQAMECLHQRVGDVVEKGIGEKVV